MAGAGVPDIKEKLLTGYQAGDSTYQVHLDGYNLMPLLKGETETGPRKEFLYWTDDGELAALRYDKWKLNFMVQRAHGFAVWEEPFIPLRFPMVEDLHADPFERGPEEGMDYDHWRADRVFLVLPGVAYVSQWIQSFQQFPPRQKPATFNLNQVMQEMSVGAANENN